MAAILDDYLSPTECAAELGISAATLPRWHRLGDGPPRIKLGRKTLYSREAVRGWLKSREQRSAAA